MAIDQVDPTVKTQIGRTGAADGLTALSAIAATRAIRLGDITAESYAEALLARAKELEDLNAFRILHPEMVLEAARAADKLRASGGALGLLHGLPIPVKDSVNSKALPTSNGTPALRDFRPNGNAALLDALLTQGAILMGKTSLHELSLGWTSNNAAFGPVRNPYDRTRVPGGSSGGSAAAVAARLAPLAVGEDTLGSVRVPASCCGIVGLRPTFGRYSSEGVMPMIGGLDQVGPLARSVADIVLFDAAVTGHTDTVSPASLKGIRIGVSSDFLSFGLAPEVEQVVQNTLEKLADAGAAIVEVRAPDTAKAALDVALTLASYELAGRMEGFLDQQNAGISLAQMLDQASPAVQGMFKAMALPPNQPPKEVYQAMVAKRQQLKEEIQRTFRDNNIVALAFPTIPVSPPKIGEDEEVQVGDTKMPLIAAMGRNVALGSCASLASLVLPAGITPAGLPIGLEFAALSDTDRDLFSLGLSLEKTIGAIPGPIL